MPNLRDFFFNYEAEVVGIHSASDYPYLKILRVMLSLISSWPLKELGMPEPQVLAIFLRLLYFAISFGSGLGAIIYIILHQKSLNLYELGHIYITILIPVVNLCRLTTLTLVPKYRDVAKDFLTKMHLFYHKEKSEYCMKTHKQVHRISHLFTLCLVFQMLTGLCLFNLIPMYNNFAAGKYKSGGLKNSTFEHSLYYSYPFNTSTRLRGYIIACILHWYFSLFASICFCMSDLFLSIMVFHLWGHFKILIHNLNTFPKPSIQRSLFLEEHNVTIIDEKFTESELMKVKDKLSECVLYHRMIVHFTDRMSNVFGPMLFVYYVFHQASGCILLLECSQMTTEALIRYLPLTIILFQQLMQMSIVFELVGSESEKLKDAVYGLPWESMDIKNRRIVIILLMHVQEPVHVKALGVANVGVTSMAKILKTSLSYFTFLRSM